MNALFQAVEVVLPVVLVLMLGNLFARTRDFSNEQARGLGKLVYWVALPALIFRDVARSHAGELFDLTLVIGLSVVLVIMGVFSYYYALWSKVPKNQIGVVAQAAFRCNMLYVGLPVVLYHVALGLTEAGAKEAHNRASGLSALTLAVAVPLLNIGSILFFVIPTEQKLSPWKLAVLSVRNPLILAVLLGLLVQAVPVVAARLAPQTVLGKTLDLAGSAALPLALLSVGAILDPRRACRHWRQTLPIAAIKLLAMPALGMLVLWFAGVREIALAVGIVLLACPVATSSHAMAVEMGGDDVLAGDLVAITTLLCPFTLVFWLIVLSSLGA